MNSDFFKEIVFQNRCYLVFLALVLMLGSCKEKNPVNGNDNDDPEVFSIKVDSTGGTLMADDGKVQITFPQGSVDTSVTITVQKAEDDIADNFFSGSAYDLGPSGTQFAKPVELQMAYDPNEMPNDVSEDSLVIIKLLDNGDRQIFATDVDKTNKHVRTTIRSFSSYGPQYWDAGPANIRPSSYSLTAQYNSDRTIDLEIETRLAMDLELQRAIIKGRFVAYDADFERIAELQSGTGTIRSYTDNDTGEAGLYFYRARAVSGSTLYPFSEQVKVTVFEQITPCADFTIATANGSAPANVNSELDITINRINGFSQPIGLQLESKDPMLTLEEIFSGYRFVPNPTQGDAKLNYTLSPVWSPGRTFNFTIIGSTSTANCTGNASITVDAAPPAVDPEVFTLAGNGTAGFADGQGSNAQFDAPWSLDFDDNTQTIYVADFYNHAIRAISGDGVVTTIAGNGSPGSQNGNNATFDNPVDVALNVAGNHLYVSDYKNHQIRRIDLSNGSVITYAGTGTTGNDDGPAGSASFHFPGGLLIHDGLLFVADISNHTIRTITIESDPADAVVDTYAGSGIRGDQDGPNEQARFNAPIDLAHDPVTDRLLVLDFQNNKIKAVDPNSTSSPSGFITPGNAPMEDPSGIVVDSQGTVYVTHNHILRKFIPLGQGVYDEEIIAGEFQSPGFNDGLGPDARLTSPRGLALGAIIDGGTVKLAIIIADVGNHAIRYIPLER